MPVIIRPEQEILEHTRRSNHAGCFLCGKDNPYGLRLDFHLRDDGAVEAKFSGAGKLQGYEGILHGGIISSLLDSAMANCLFAHGIVALTAEIRVRFRHPVKAESPLVVSAKICGSIGALYTLDARILQYGKDAARGYGKFIVK